MQTAAALRLARSLMNEHGLHDWTLTLDRAKTRAGAMFPRQRRISLSGPLTRVHSEEQVRDTILHEIAHALVGHQHGHDRVWKAKARELGASDQRCFSSEEARELAPFIGICPAGHEVRRHKRPTRLVSCSRCSSRYDPNSIFEWTYRGHSFTHSPAYAKALDELRSLSTSAPPPRPTLQLGALARITADGRYHGCTGEVEAVGRSRYQVRVDDLILNVPFELVEPA